MTAPTPHPSHRFCGPVFRRSRATGSRIIRTTSTARRAARTSVWSLTDAAPLPGTALLSGWLGQTLLSLVRGYTQPGHRVLLLTPPAPPRRAGAATHGVINGWFGPDPYAGLEEASWTISRLGRGVITAPASPPDDYPDAPTVIASAARTQSESGAGLSDPTGRTKSDPDRPGDGTPATQSDQTTGTFDLIITAIHAHAVDWLSAVDWTACLTSGDPRGDHSW